jgi:hypothetical protein
MSFLEYQHTVDKRKSADLHNLLAARDFVITCIKSTNAPGEEELREDLDLIEQLRDGVILCRLVNCVKPNTIRVIHKQKLHYRMMDNINRFVEVCRTLGVDENQLFSPLELIRKTDGIQYKVVKCILVLKEYKETGKIEHPKQDRLRTPIPPKSVGLPSLAHANSVGNHAPDFSAPRGVHQPPQVLHHPVYVPPHTTESHGNTPVHTPQCVLFALAASCNIYLTHTFLWTQIGWRCSSRNELFALVIVIIIQRDAKGLTKAR